MNVAIDPYAGFCFGVEKAVGTAETALRQQKNLFCLGDIVHNPRETSRLAEMGLVPLDTEQFEGMEDTTVLIRAHGEPPATYHKARIKNLKLLDATCPVVLKLQERIRKAYHEMKTAGGTVIIAGKKNHPEVIGLLGHTEGDARVAESPEDIGTMEISFPVRVFAQTTMDPDRFNQLVERLKNRMEEQSILQNQMKVHNTICGHVKNRIPKLKSFCSGFDVILFVSGRESSNGKALYNICREANPSSYFITGPNDIDATWIRGKASVGISGATSTPAWLMQEVADKLKEK